MKKYLLFSSIALLSGSLIAADSTPKEDVTAAAKKLGDSSSYSWKATTVVPESAQFKPGPTEGKLEKDGYTHVKMSFGDNTSQFVLKGEKAAVTGPDGTWQALSELEADQGPGRFVTRMVKNFKSPSAQAVELVNGAKELTKDGDAYSSDLTDEGAKAQFRFGNVTNPKGSVKFWVKDGVLTKFEFKTQGKVDFNGNEMDIDRDTTVEIKDVNSTKTEIPDDAKKKLS